MTDRASAENAFKLLPLSFLALRVSKVSSNYNKGKRVKGLWTVKVEQHQDTDPMTHYVWLYEGPQWKQKALAAAFVAGIFAIVLFPLWPVMLRQGVWYLSVGMLGLLGLFFALAIFRLILFCVTVFAVPPGIWLFPNLFEDVGFVDSFKPLWAWNEVSLSSLFRTIPKCALTCALEEEEKVKERQNHGLAIPGGRRCFHNSSNNHLFRNKAQLLQRDSIETQSGRQRRRCRRRLIV